MGVQNTACTDVKNGTVTKCKKTGEFVKKHSKNLQKDNRYMKSFPR